MTDEEKKKVDDWVNDKIEKRIPVTHVEMSVDEAKKAGAEGNSWKSMAIRLWSILLGMFPERSVVARTSKTLKLGHFRIKKKESSSAE